jgi:hypothetical protein
MPLVQTRGAASAQGFGEFAQASGGGATYIEDVFSTYLYTGNGSTQTITNGIDLSTKGGLVWTKDRNSGANHQLFDTSRGLYKRLATNSTAAEYNYSPDGLTAFNANGFTMTGNGDYNSSGYLIASWTFRKQPKFFDIVTFSGNSTNRTVAHNLGSVPGCIIVKDLQGGNWNVYHRSLANTQALVLNTTDAVGSAPTYWNSTTPTSTEFSLGTSSQVNFSGHDYVAYLFAYDAGGFGLTGTDNVISCGSYSGTGSDMGVTLGYEPQYVMIKRTDSTGDWWIGDTMRGFNLQGVARLEANTSDAEAAIYNGVQPTATGFFLPAGTALNGGGDTFIYIAIRRGPMKVPTDATKVFSPNRWTSTVGSAITTNFPLDLQISRWMGGGDSNFVQDRLRGLNTVTTNSAQPYLFTESTAAEGTNSGANYNFGSTGFLVGDNDSGNGWAVNFRRAPSFFDEVCYTGDNAATRTLAHNLTVAPELIIVRMRNSSGFWNTFFNFGSTSCSIMTLEDTAAASSSDYTGAFSKLGGAPTSSSFIVTNPFFGEINTSGTTYVTYLFATCAGVSKVGSYTGNGSTQTINCGFGAGGARFVLLKRTDSTGGWYVYDTARGMTVLTDPYLLLNSTAAEVATLGSVTTVATGFALNATILAAINTNAASYIFLAIA